MDADARDIFRIIRGSATVLVPCVGQKSNEFIAFFFAGGRSWVAHWMQACRNPVREMDADAMGMLYCQGSATVLAPCEGKKKQ